MVADVSYPAVTGVLTGLRELKDNPAYGFYLFVIVKIRKVSKFGNKS